MTPLFLLRGDGLSLFVAKCRFLSQNGVGCLLNDARSRSYVILDKKPRKLGRGSILIPSSCKMISDSKDGKRAQGNLALFFFL